MVEVTAVVMEIGWVLRRHADAGFLRFAQNDTKKQTDTKKVLRAKLLQRAALHLSRRNRNCADLSSDKERLRYAIKINEEGEPVMQRSLGQGEVKDTRDQDE
jgi:hypothetical protein